MSEQLAPIAPPDLLAEVEALRLHYGEWADLDVSGAKRLHRDWIEDFDGFPAALVRVACQRWRKSNAKRPPSPGELMAIVEPDLLKVRHLGWQAMKAREALASADR